MELGRRSSRALKRKVFDLLSQNDFDQAWRTLSRLPERRTVNPLFSFLCHRDPQIRWRAVTAMGMTVASLADKDMESARVIMRRLMWMLNDESGGIGWGVPEAMAEIMARHEGLAQEYVHILISYMSEEANFLEHELLQRGVAWGVGRLAQVRPALVNSKNAIRYLQTYLDSKDATVRGLAVWAMGLLEGATSRREVESLLHDNNVVTIYLNDKLVRLRVSDLAKDALCRPGNEVRLEQQPVKK